MAFLKVRPLAASVALVGVLLAAGCGSGNGSWNSPGSGGSGANGGSDSSDAPTAAQLDVAVVPAADAKDVSPIEPVTVSVNSGSLTEVKMTNAEGKAVKGELGSDGKTWKADTELGYNKTYTLAITGKTEDGQESTKESKFTTVKPANMTLPYLRANMNTLLGTGKTYGVGQPVVIWFDEPIKDKAAAQKRLTITTDPPVEGAWHWFDDREVHWRPQLYWKPGTKVTVKADVYGYDMGGGLYGQQDVNASFTIGKSKIAIADHNTKRMKIYIDGQQLMSIAGKNISAGIPISMGKGGSEKAADGKVVDYRTNSGVHVVTTKHEEYRMTSASYGITDKNSPNYYDELIKKAVRISTSGEFVHLADWNIPQHGRTNTSHGCVNVAPTYINWFFTEFGAGDIVDIKNTGKALDVRDGLGDWNMSWDKWVAGSAA